MVHSNKILDLIEAIEVSAEKLNYELSEKEQALIRKLKNKAEKGMSVSNNYWELLCDLFNRVEGRLRMVDEGFSSTRAITLYAIIPTLIILISVFFYLLSLLLGGK